MNSDEINIETRRFKWAKGRKIYLDDEESVTSTVASQESTPAPTSNKRKSSVLTDNGSTNTPEEPAPKRTGPYSEYTNGNPAGFINPSSRKTKTQKMQWTVENDNKLLMFTLGRLCPASEYKEIVKEFPENPTEKAIAERLTKLRKEQMILLEELGITKGEFGMQKGAKRGKKSFVPVRVPVVEENEVGGDEGRGESVDAGRQEPGSAGGKDDEDAAAAGQGVSCRKVSVNMLLN